MGKLDLAAFKTLVEDAINSYLEGIFFNGKFNINKFRDAIEKVSGTLDTDNILVEVKPEAGAYASVDRENDPASGYYKIDAVYPLATQITYVGQ